MIGMLRRARPLARLAKWSLAYVLLAGAAYGAWTYDPLVPFSAPSTKQVGAVGVLARPATPATREAGRLPPEQAFSAIVMRPLFSPTRRPPTVAMAVAPTSATAHTGSLAHLTLSGIVITPEDRFALLEQRKEPRFVEARPGDRIEGWELAAIEKDRVIFQAASQHHELLLEPATHP